MRVQIDSQYSPLAHPPPPKMAASRHLLCTAMMAASFSSPLKRISTDGKNGRHLGGTSHVAPHSPDLVFSLPVIIFVFV